MAKKSGGKTAETEHPRPAMIRPGSVFGGALAVLGFAGVFYSNKRPGELDWLWYVSVGVGVAGVLLWFLSGMPREQAIEWVKSGLFAIGLALLIRWPIAEPYRIPSGSMEPTLHGDERIGRGDRVAVNKWIYGIRYPFMNKRIYHGKAPERWDIVVFKSVEKDSRHKTLVKRIVGLPGERIELRPDPQELEKAGAHFRGTVKATLYVDGKPLDIPGFMPEGHYYTAPGVMPPPPGRPTDEIPWQEKRMLFGIRPEDAFSLVPEGHYLLMGDNSANSRDGRYFGWMPNEHLVGRVAGVWWPPTRWCDFTGFSETWWWKTLVTLVGVLLAVRVLAGRSWAVSRPGGKGLEHLFVSFLSLGLRVPFTPWWLIRWGRVRRGDLVLFGGKWKDLPSGTVLLGRVAGLPGEKVVIQGGKVSIDGRPLDQEPWAGEANYTSANPEARYGRSKSKEHSKVPEGHYFILTDNPQDEEALDSRTLGWIPQTALAGKATAVWWPPARWRRLR